MEFIGSSLYSLIGINVCSTNTMMVPLQWFVNKRINIKLVASCVLSVALVTTPVALAEYVPPSVPPSSPPPSSSTVGGRRGGVCDGGDMPLTVLASRKYIAKTISGRPTFAWFVPDSRPFDMEFTIVEIGSGGKKGKEVLSLSLQSSQGIMKLSPFSPDAPGLEVGKVYFWEVAILCDGDHPENARVDGASIEVVEIPTTVQSQLNKAVDSFEKVNIYGKAGLWYDALGEALKVAKASKLGEVGSSLLKDLAKWEAPKITPEWLRQNCKPNHSGQETPKLISPECKRNDLEQIADRER
jgi:hypothetical protein